MNFWQYSPRDVSILLYGFYRVEGIASGTFVSITKDLQPFETARTVDGMVYRKHTRDDTYTIELTINSLSPANNVLTKLWQLDDATKMGKFPIFIKDSSAEGTAKFFSSTTWVERLPPLALGDDITPRTWVLRSSQGVMNIGGNGGSDTLQDLTTLLSSGLPLASSILSDVLEG